MKIEGHEALLFLFIFMEVVVKVPFINVENMI
jgi:hypothetical protein